MNKFAHIIVIVSISAALIGGWLLGTNSTQAQVQFALGVVLGCMFVACMWISASHQPQQLLLKRGEIDNGKKNTQWFGEGVSIQR